MIDFEDCKGIENKAELGLDKKNYKPLKIVQSIFKEIQNFCDLGVLVSLVSPI